MLQLCWTLIGGRFMVKKKDSPFEGAAPAPLPTPPPDSLCKYISLSSPYGLRNIWRALARNELYFSSPSRFNDPFEYRPRAHDPDLKFADEIEPESLPGIIQELYFQTVAVCCFSAVDPILGSHKGKNAAALLWSHYGDSHRGLCLEFASTIYNGQALSVRYSDARPAKIENPQSIKAREWEYESEYRVSMAGIVDGSPKVASAIEKYEKFQQHELKRITLGARISEDDREMVLDWIRKRTPPPEARIAELDPDDFRLRSVPINF